MKAKDYKITISWNVEDVLSLDDSLTTDQCIEVLDMAGITTMQIMVSLGTHYLGI